MDTYFYFVRREALEGLQKTYYSPNPVCLPLLLKPHKACKYTFPAFISPLTGLLEDQFSKCSASYCQQLGNSEDEGLGGDDGAGAGGCFLAETPAKALARNVLADSAFALPRPSIDSFF